MRPAITVENLSKAYRIGLKEEIPDTLVGALTSFARSPYDNFRNLRRLNTFRNNGHAEDDIVWALKDVSFEVQRGEVVGIIGRNGAGKSTLLKVLSRITEPTSGRAVIRGRVSSLLEVGTGFHPELSGRENIYMNGTILGMKKREIDRKFDEIVDFSGVEKFLDTPIKRYSSGMKVRLAFSVAAHLEPEILVIDEVLAVGDAEFQSKCLAKMGSVARSGRTVLFVSHNLGAIRSLCSSAAILAKGMLMSVGETSEQIGRYLSGLTDTTDISLADRTDREGDGRARITNLRFEDSYGRELSGAVAGTPLSVWLTYNCDVPASELEVALSCWSSDGVKLFHCDSRTYSRRLFTQSAGEVHCLFPKLPLIPGRYFFNAMLKVGGKVADHIYSAGSIDVLPGDFHGVGRPTPRSGEIIFVDHAWEVTNN